MIILAGHTRLAASIELQLKQVPVHIAKGLSEAQKKAFRIMDNKSAEFAIWDKALLKDELLAIADLDFDMTATGFDLSDINKLTADALLNLPNENDDDDLLLEDESVDNFQPSNVRLFQLFFNTETEKIFREMCRQLQEYYHLDNISDTVYKVIEDANKSIKS
jgi:ParB-like chromosome segregation protein Spo0J